MEARSFYKAFLTKKGDPDVMMKVDTSGDTFSPTMIDAVRTLFTAGLQSADLLKVPFSFFFSDAETTEDGEPVEVPKPEGTEPEYTDIITIIRITPLNQDQFDAAVIDGDATKMSCLVAVKNLTDGYQSAIMEYKYNHIEVFQLKGHTDWVLQKINATRNMETDNSDEWPVLFEWKLPKKYRHNEKADGVSYTMF